jgi:hypothetical protein
VIYGFTLGNKCDLRENSLKPEDLGAGMEIVKSAVRTADAQVPFDVLRENFDLVYSLMKL